MTSEILNLVSGIQTALNTASQIQTAMTLDSGFATNLNTESDINTSMAISSLIELEAA